MAQYQTGLQGDGWPRGVAIATAAPWTSAALMEKTRERSPAKGCSGSHINNISSSAKISMDEKLCRQIQKVLELPDGSECQKGEMDKLLRLIPNLPGIYKSQNPTIEQQDAFNRALEGVSVCRKKVTGENLRRFVEKRNLDLATEDPSNVRVLFLRWFNRILKHKNAEIYREQKQHLSLDAPIQGGDGATTHGNMICSDRPTGLDRIIEENKEQNWQKFQGYIEEDPEGKLKKCCSRKHPQLNCHELAKRRLLKDPPDQWHDIAEELKVPFGNLGPRWNRNCKPLLQEIAKSFGLTLENSHE